MRNLTRNPIKKLLAVVAFVGAASTSVIAAPRTLANGAPAPGNTVAKGKDTPRQRAARALADARARLLTALAEERELTRELAAQPRTLPNGAPACGNTLGKVQRECTPAIADKEFDERVERLRFASARVKQARSRVHEATQQLASAPRYGRDLDDDYS